MTTPIMQDGRDEDEVRGRRHHASITGSPPAWRSRRELALDAAQTTPEHQARRRRPRPRRTRTRHTDRGAGENSGGGALARSTNCVVCTCADTRVAQSPVRSATAPRPVPRRRARCANTFSSQSSSARYACSSTRRLLLEPGADHQQRGVQKQKAELAPDNGPSMLAGRVGRTFVVGCIVRQTFTDQ